MLEQLKDREKTEIEKAIDDFGQVEHHARDEKPQLSTKEIREKFEYLKERDLQNLKSDILKVTMEIIDEVNPETAPYMEDFLKKLKWFRSLM